MLGISLCSYLYLKLAKTLCLSYYLLCFFSNKIGEEGEQAVPGREGVKGRGGELRMGGEVAQVMFIHMNICTNN
jgi:hypothetical protein